MLTGVGSRRGSVTENEDKNRKITETDCPHERPYHTTTLQPKRCRRKSPKGQEGYGAENRVTLEVKEGLRVGVVRTWVTD